jgi:Domain of unknown function (DUF6766)
VRGRAEIGFWQFLRSGDFIEALAVNWQAAILQLASLILFSRFFYQLGAPHSRNPRRPARRHRWRRFGWVYRNSLSLAFPTLFVATLIVHVVYGAAAYDQQRLLAGQAPLSPAEFLLSAKFWSSTFQTWQAEYLVIALYVVLSVFLRQKDSPESKPVEAGDQSTGEVNK